MAKSTVYRSCLHDSFSANIPKLAKRKFMYQMATTNQNSILDDRRQMLSEVSTIKKDVDDDKTIIAAMR